MQEKIKDDTISRQAAIKEVIAWLRDRMENNKNGKPLTDRLRELPSTQPEPQWIPVSERLPEMKKPILATYETVDGLKVGRTMYDRYGFMIGEVTAWMPFPEPWKGEQE